MRLPLFIALVCSTFLACPAPHTGNGTCEPPLLFGHRGTVLFAPENTLPAFGYAMDHGGDGIEVDIQLTLDGEIVAFHDLTTGRTTNDSSDRSVAGINLSELKSLDAGAWFAPEYAGTRVPTLKEVLDEFSADTRLLLDLKGQGVDIAVAEFIKAYDIAARVLVSSFDLTQLAVVHQTLPEIPLMYYVAQLEDAESPEATIATYIRVPKAMEDDWNTQDQVLQLGFLPAVSGRYTEWNGGIALVNNMSVTRERREKRKPEECE